MAVDLLLSKQGICKKFDLPPSLSLHELEELDMAFLFLQRRVELAWDWYYTERYEGRVTPVAQNNFHIPRHYDHISECQVQLT